MMAMTDEPPEEFQDDETPSGSASTSPQPPLPSPSPIERKRASIEMPPMELDPLNLKVDPENSKLLQAVQGKASHSLKIGVAAFSPRNLMNQIR
ncbi:unnamed protein product, partial [Mesorhabditis belari]|uniref:Uncharacterized protein n=1 Tax=Mesorhabditis belari TaxID=2138241 RepID=A0AAF3J1V2_9BILA